MNKLQILIKNVLNEDAVAGSVGQALGAQVGIFNDNEKYPVKVALATAGMKFEDSKKKKKPKKGFPKVIRRNLPSKTL
jgi:hypothetical protein